MQRNWLLLFITAVAFSVFGLVGVAQAQDEAPDENLPPLLLVTDFPSQTVGTGESPSFNLTLRSGRTPQIVELSVEDLPDGWEAIFKGRGRIIQSAYVQPDKDVSLDLKLTIPDDAAAGAYTFTVIADGEDGRSELPVTLTLQDKLPPNLVFEVDLPVLRGKPDGTFRFNTTLKNEGDEDLIVDLSAELPPGFLAVFKSAGQEVTSLPLEANDSKRINVEVESTFGILTPAGDYLIVVRAVSEQAEVETQLVAQVAGESQIQLTTPDGRLSGELQASKSTPVKLLLINTGSAPARKIKLSSTAPRGWEVTMDPETVPELKADEQIEVTAYVQPAEKALAGD
ncbi:MAG TPA: hypothetical protein ENK32_08605, partial [Anaerolineae bacterium]|nr:hypothetical protein [Anaerolineae bacterium]